MSKMGCLFFAVLDRRGFCSSIAVGAVSVIFAKLPFAAEQSLHLANTDQEFLVINGWVLTSEDFAETEMTNHVARL
jgi:hypothetical protein